MLLKWDWVFHFELCSFKCACVVIQGRLSIKGFTRLKLRRFINYKLITYTMARK